MNVPPGGENHRAGRGCLWRRPWLVAGEMDQRVLNVLRRGIEGGLLWAVVGRGWRGDGANQDRRGVEVEEAALGDPRVNVPPEARQVRLLGHDDRAIRLAHRG